MQQASSTIIQNIGIVGAGAMGRGIAQIAAQAGVKVKLFDLQSGAAEGAREAVITQLKRLQEKGKLDASAVGDASRMIEPVGALDALAGCQLVIEAIVERLDVKRDLFRQLEGIVAEDCILATNTSSLSVTAIAAATTRPERVAGFHFFNPVPLMKVVEIISGVLTDQGVAASLVELGRRMGHTPVQAKDTPGFIVNHAGRGYLTESLRIAQECVAEFSAIDDVLREAAGFRLGPFQLLDLTGLDVSHPVMESIYQQYYQEPRYRPSVITAQRLSAGLLGRKTGRGFYRYDDTTGTELSAQESAEAWTGQVWIAPTDMETAKHVTALMDRCGVTPDMTGEAGRNALCVVTPMGEDISTCVARLGLDARRTVGIDTLGDCAGRLTLMTCPGTEASLALQAKALLEKSGQAVTLIEDSPGFIVQRVLATIVNIGCDIAQQGVCTPEDLDSAVELGLGYPRGPLAWGDRIGATRVLMILNNLHRVTGDPRYRPSPWLTRRAQLGLSLRHGRN